jgi:hypothetical protein
MKTTEYTEKHGVNIYASTEMYAQRVYLGPAEGQLS